MTLAFGCDHAAGNRASKSRLRKDRLTQPERDPFRRIVWSLAVAETLVWAAMYYLFPALLRAWEQDLGWSKVELSGALTISLILSALLAPFVGRVIDRGYGTQIFTGGALLGAGCLVALSRVYTVRQFYLIWALLGVAMAASLYEPCFAILTKTMGLRSKQAITVVTLVAGFAGTVSFSSTHFLVGWVGWRSTVLVMAATIALVATPLIRLGCRAAEAHGAAHAAPASTRAAETIVVARSAIFWLLALGFASIALNHGVLLTHILPLLDERGVQGGLATLAASMIGPMQVAGRLMMLGAERRFSSVTIFTTCFLAMGIAALLLLGSVALPSLVIGFVLFQGAGYGVTSILRPVITAELLGHRNFGMIAGMLAVPFMAAAAAAPTIAALIWGVGGYDIVIWFAIGVIMLGLTALVAAARTADNRRPTTVIDG